MTNLSNPIVTQLPATVASGLRRRALQIWLSMPFKYLATGAMANDAGNSQPTQRNAG